MWCPGPALNRQAVWRGRPKDGAAYGSCSTCLIYPGGVMTHVDVRMNPGIKKSLEKVSIRELCNSLTARGVANFGLSA